MIVVSMADYFNQGPLNQGSTGTNKYLLKQF
jgi:hypothetical protein